MNSRLVLYQLAKQHGLDPLATRSLIDDAYPHQEPMALRRSLWPSIAILAALLVGMGIILWLAANWDTLGRMPRFALLQVVVAVACAGAAWQARLRAPLGLVALLAIGGLFAYFGQTYQTGADPWQLFAAWALLALPLCLGARSDVLWAPWALVAMTAVSLWVYAHAGHRWHAETDDWRSFAVAWAAATALVLALSPALKRWTGAGIWAVRTAATLAVMGITLSALDALFGTFLGRGVPMLRYALALALFALAALLLAQRRWFEVFLLSAVALGLNILLVTGMARWIFLGGSNGGVIPKILAIGLIAAALLAASVSFISRLAARYAESQR